MIRNDSMADDNKTPNATSTAKPAAAEPTKAAAPAEAKPAAAQPSQRFTPPRHITPRPHKSHRLSASLPERAALDRSRLPPATATRP